MVDSGNRRNHSQSDVYLVRTFDLCFLEQGTESQMAVDASPIISGQDKKQNETKV